MNPKDFWEVARFLAKNSSSESAIRTVVSRAYYGMIIYIRDILKKELHIPFAPGENIHNLIPRYLSYSQVSGASKVANEISHFRDMRNDADYAMDVAFTEMDKLWIATAEDIIARFDKLDKKKLQAGILTYLRTINAPK
jgi:uncharacterized protein (UPF0332 family)